MSENLLNRNEDPLGNRVQDAFFHFLARFFETFRQQHGLPSVEKGVWYDTLGPEYRSALHALVGVSPDAERQEMTLVRTLCVSWNQFSDFAPAEAERVFYDYARYQPFLVRGLYRVLLDVLRVNPTETHELFYHVVFRDITNICTVRNLRAAQCNVLCVLHATVTRVSQVRPELVQACFSCQNCGCVSEPILQNYTYTTPMLCNQNGCGNRDMWTVVHNRHTIVCDWQKIKVQEDSESLLPGSVPRTIDVIVRGDFVEKAMPGDKVELTGFVSVVPEVGKLLSQQERRELTLRCEETLLSERSMNERPSAEVGPSGIEGLQKLGVRTLAYKLCFIALTVGDRHGNVRLNPRTHDPRTSVAETASLESDTVREAQEEVVQHIIQQPHFFDALVQSVCPNVFGYKLVKLGILLQLVGGVHKVAQDGTSLRGDINICLVGDPAVAKSHFLKWAAKVSPRGIYTEGKTSTAAGLTASVAKDSETNEFTIEAGALMLADDGMCCIDDFDKMEPTDMMAIHEAMEQQTISIAKAGIKATLQARASILAAASPIGGIYNISKPLHQNVIMTQPIMSRFDLIFILADTSNGADRSLAERLTELHRTGESDVRMSGGAVLTHEQFLLYVNYARDLKPRLSDAACHLLAAAFRDLRREKTRTITHRMFRYTARQLESMIRLSEAVARLHLDEEVRPAHVHLALTLMRASMHHSEIGAEPEEGAGLSLIPSEMSFGEPQLISSTLQDLIVECLKQSPKVSPNLSDFTEWIRRHVPEQVSKLDSSQFQEMLTTTLGTLLRSEKIKRKGVADPSTPIRYTDTFSCP